MRGHHAAHPGLDRGRERRQVAGPDVASSSSTTGRARCESTAGGAVPREVLGAGGEPGWPAARARTPRRAATTSAGSAPNERIADDRVVRVGVDVDDRRERPGRRPRRGPGAPIARGDPLGGVGVVERARARRAPGHDEPVAVLEPGDVAALLVGRDQHARPTRRAARRSARRPGRRRDVLRRTGTRPPARRRAGRASQSGTVVPANPAAARTAVGQAGSDATGVVSRHPFTAPATRPSVSRRCTSTKNTMTGTRDQRRGRPSPRPSRCRTGRRTAAARRRRCSCSSSFMNVRAKMNSFHAVMKREHAGRHQPGRHQREQDRPEHPPPRRPVDVRRLLDLDGHRGDEAAQRPDRERQRERDVDDDQPEQACRAAARFRAWRNSGMHQRLQRHHLHDQDHHQHRRAEPEAGTGRPRPRRAAPAAPLASTVAERRPAASCAGSGAKPPSSSTNAEVARA